MSAPRSGRPWLDQYGDLPATIEPQHQTAVAMAAAALRAFGDSPAVWYFEHPLSGEDVASDADAAAEGLRRLGVQPGDRVALYLQNDPQTLVALLAAWGLGAIAVPVNPMLKERELRGILADSGATVLIALDELIEDVARHIIDDTAVGVVVETSALDHLGDVVPPPLSNVRRRHSPGTIEWRALLAEHAGHPPPRADVVADDIALLVYTSGTTGPPKGAMILHRNVVFSSEVFRQWAGLDSHDVNLVLAPLFHVTGLIAGVGASLAAAMPLVLSHRFEARTVLELCRRYRPSFTVAAITAYTALMNHPDFRATDVSSLRAAFSGGAPVPSAIVERWEAATGRYIHNAYGLTETTSPSHLTPLGLRAPVDPSTGTLAVGLPVSDTTVEVLDEQGRPLPTGQIGELVTSGPQVVPGYWGKPDETRQALPDGRLRTGDVGFMDEQGWFYLVDRRKDMIVAAGYKVWPREVEDVLYEHDAVREAAVVGVPDEYRGETVKAYVSLRPGAHAGAGELIAFCRERLAAYKIPRDVEILEDLPKTSTGKILRRELRGPEAGGGLA